MISSFQFTKRMLKLFLTFILFFSTSFAVEIKIEATVNSQVITSFDLKVRMEISKIINPQSFKQNTPEAIKASILERLIQEKLLFKAASESGFSIPISEIESSAKITISENPNLKGKNIKALFGEAGYKSFIEQTKGEIIFNAILSSYAKGKTDFSKDEINKFTKFQSLLLLISF